MFRTRDFVVLFTLIVFLIVAIAATLFKQYGGRHEVAAVQFAASEDTSYSAEVVTAPPFSRAEKLSEMRNKIAKTNEVLPEQPEEVEVVIEETAQAEVPEAASVTKRCAQYRTYGQYWAPQGITFAVAEGARVVSRAIPVVVGTTTTESSQVLLQLPATPTRSGEYCLASDVIGIAQDGSLIKNGEVALYGVFGEHTLIGYALDGFPIYGTSDVATDICGGAVVNGSYSYYLSEHRETILNCFAATPVTL